LPTSTPRNTPISACDLLSIRLQSPIAPVARRWQQVSTPTLRRPRHQIDQSSPYQRSLTAVPHRRQHKLDHSDRKTKSYRCGQATTPNQGQEEGNVPDNRWYTDRPSRASSACRWCPFLTAAHTPVGPVWGPERTTHYESLAGRSVVVLVGVTLGHSNRIAANARLVSAERVNPRPY
jgi:hypothetical protein